MAVMNIERAVEETARATSRLAEPHLRNMQRYLEESHRRISDQLRRGWPSSLPIESRLFREARAREILAQLNPTLDTLRLGTAGHPLTAEMRQMILAGHKTAVPTSFYKRLAAAAPARWGANLSPGDLQELVQFGVAVDVTAVEAQVRNLSALGRLAEAGVLDPQTIAEAEARTRNAMFRLGRYGEQAIDGVNQAVVDGMVQGKGWRSVAREVRGAILGDPHAPGTKGGLAFRAETVARTEMMSAGNESRTQHYRDNGISQVIWMATADERTCEYCGGRSGNIYDLDKTVVPAHPRCRCVISPFRKEWMDEGIITEEQLDGHADDVLREYRSATRDPSAVFPTRAPSVFERSAGLTQAVGPIRRAGTLYQAPPIPPPPAPPAAPPLSTADDGLLNIALQSRGMTRAQWDAIPLGERWRQQPRLLKALPREEQVRVLLATPEAQRNTLAEILGIKDIPGMGTAYAPSWPPPAGAKLSNPLTADPSRHYRERAGSVTRAAGPNDFEATIVDVRGAFGSRKVGFQVDGGTRYLPRMNADIVMALDRYDELIKVPLRTVVEDGIALIGKAGDPALGKSLGVAYGSDGGPFRQILLNGGSVPATRDAYMAKTYSMSSSNWTVQLTTPNGASRAGYMYHTTLHEIGHTFEGYLRVSAVGNPSRTNALKAMVDGLYQAQVPSAYAKTNIKERFAEAFSEILLKPADSWSESGRLMADFLRLNKEWVPNAF